MIKREELIRIGQFGKPHGVKGEIALQADRDVFDDSADLYIVCEMDGIFVPFFVEDYRYKTDTVILLKLDRVDDEQSAREFVNRDVYFPINLIDEEDFYDELTWDQLVGYLVVDQRIGVLGPITDIDDSTLNILLQIDHEGEELLIPAAEELIIDLDNEAKRLEVSLPEGLLDL